MHRRSTRHDFRSAWWPPRLPLVGARSMAWRGHLVSPVRRRTGGSMRSCLIIVSARLWALHHRGVDETAPVRDSATQCAVETDRGVGESPFRAEVHGNAVDAIALVCGRWAVREHVPQMTSAARAVHLGPNHAMTAIYRRLDGTIDGVIETRPTRAALELQS